MKKKSKSRLHNPFDGSSKSTQQVHKSKKDYDRKKNRVKTINYSQSNSSDMRFSVENDDII